MNPLQRMLTSRIGSRLLSRGLFAGIGTALFPPVGLAILAAEAVLTGSDFLHFLDKKFSGGYLKEVEDTPLFIPTIPKSITPAAVAIVVDNFNEAATLVNNVGDMAVVEPISQAIKFTVGAFSKVLSVSTYSFQYFDFFNRLTGKVRVEVPKVVYTPPIYQRPAFIPKGGGAGDVAKVSFFGRVISFLKNWWAFLIAMAVTPYAFTAFFKAVDDIVSLGEVFLVLLAISFAHQTGVESVKKGSKMYVHMAAVVTFGVFMIRVLG